MNEHYEKVSQSVEALLDGAEQDHMRASVEHDKAMRALSVETICFAPLVTHGACVLYEYEAGIATGGAY